MATPCVRFWVCPACDWLTGQSGRAVGASESISFPKIRTERRSSPHCSLHFHHPPLPLLCQNLKSLSIFLFLSPLLHPADRQTDSSNSWSSWSLSSSSSSLEEDGQGTPDPHPAGSPWQRSSALVSLKSISCMRSWASKYHHHHHHHQNYIMTELHHKW